MGPHMQYFTNTTTVLYNWCQPYTSTSASATVHFANDLICGMRMVVWENGGAHPTAAIDGHIAMLEMEL